LPEIQGRRILMVNYKGFYAQTGIREIFTTEPRRFRERRKYKFLLILLQKTVAEFVIPVLRNYKFRNIIFLILSLNLRGKNSPYFVCF